jgi:hypothetical protein
VQGAQYWSLRRADTALDQQLSASCQRLFGVTRASACDAEIQKISRTRGAVSSETFLSTLAAVAEARDQATRIDALSYRNRVMDLQLVAGSVDAIDAFARSLEQTKRFTPKIESANQKETGVEGRLQISVRP